MVLFTTFCIVYLVWGFVKPQMQPATCYYTKWLVFLCNLLNQPLPHCKTLATSITRVETTINLLCLNKEHGMLRLKYNQIHVVNHLYSSAWLFQDFCNLLYKPEIFIPLCCKCSNRNLAHPIHCHQL